MGFPTIRLPKVVAFRPRCIAQPVAMDPRRLIRAQPMDSVVVIGGLRKDPFRRNHGAVSADLPTVSFRWRPMVFWPHKGEVLGALAPIVRRLCGKISRRRD